MKIKPPPQPSITQPPQPQSLQHMIIQSQNQPQIKGKSNHISTENPTTIATQHHPNPTPPLQLIITHDNPIKKFTQNQWKTKQKINENQTKPNKGKPKIKPSTQT